VADAVESAKSFHVDVQQLAGTFTLVAMNRRRRIDVAQAIHSRPPANASDRGDADAGDDGDPSDGHAFTPQLDDQGTGGRVDGVRAVWSRASVRHRLIVFSAADPLVRPTYTQASGLRRLSERPATLQDAMDQQRSTCREASRILVDVHLGSSLPTCSFGHFQIGGSRPDGQAFSRNNVLVHHN